MRYLLLIYTPEVDPADVPPEVTQTVRDGYNALTRDMRERGTLQAGEALQPTASATTVRVREGRSLVTDGPFAETKEALGGFYMVDVKDLDEALDIAARIPGAQFGGVEVRPILDLPG